STASKVSRECSAKRSREVRDSMSSQSYRRKSRSRRDSTGEGIENPFGATRVSSQQARTKRSLSRATPVHDVNDTFSATRRTDPMTDTPEQTPDSSAAAGSPAVDSLAAALPGGGSEVARRLVASAVESFARRGYHATTTRDISVGAGLSPAALYVHFP